MKRFFVAMFFVVFYLPAFAQGNFKVRVVKDSLFIPWEILWGPVNNIWLTQKNGYICRLHPSTGMLDTLYHETATVIQSEGGMLGMALHPQFLSNPFVYVVYNYLQGSLYRERLVRYTYNGVNALSSPLILVDNVTSAVNHNGSRLLIEGDKLFFSTGDATVASNAQNIASPNGKIHRINLDGTIPADNPFPGRSIWSWGHRNPQGLVIAGGKIYSTEHGPNNDDEINIISRGRNYGWPNVEGFCDKPSKKQFCTDSNVAEPIYAWTPTLAVCGLDYYDAAMFPAWKNSLIMATLKDSRLYRLQLNAAGDRILSTAVISQIVQGRLRDVCFSPEGKIYVSTSNSNSSGNAAKIDKIIELSDSTFSTAVTVPAGLESLSIRPNPADRFLEGFFRGSRAEYQIISIEGVCVASGKVEAGEFKISLEALPAGSYVFVLRPGSGAGKLSRMFVKK